MSDTEQIWSCLPAILTSYNGRKGNVRPLIKIQYRDGSHIDFPEIHNVPVITPATAFAGIKLPVRVGDKVILHIADRDIQKLLNKTTTSGLDSIDSAFTQTRRKHNITDAIAYTGFQSNNDIHYNEDYKHDVWLFNNTDSDSYNHIRLKSDGSIEAITNKAQINLDKNGDISLSNEKAKLNMLNTGEVTLANQLSSLVMDILGNITLTSPLMIKLDTFEVLCTNDLSILNGSVKMSTHTHSGVTSGSSSTASPDNPS